MIPYKTKGKRLFLCPGCKRIYDVIRVYGGKYRVVNGVRTYKGQVGRKPKYYPGLSSYGLTREICPECVSRAVKFVKDKKAEANNGKPV